MAVTNVPVGSPLAVKLFSVALFHYSLGSSFWLSRFAGANFINRGKRPSVVSTSPELPIQIIRDLEKAQGDRVSFDVFVDLKGDAVYGDNRLEGNETPLTFYSDELRIDQVRRGVSAGGAMSRKRTKHDLRLEARTKLSRWFARFFDEVITFYLAGRRGISTAQHVLPTSWSGFAGNPLQPADSEHLVTVNATGDVSNTDTDATTLKLNWFDKIHTYIATMDTPPNPVMIGGEPYYIVLLHPKAVEQMKADTGTGSWLDVHKLAGVRGPDNPIFKGLLGEYGGFLFYEYSKIPVYTGGGKTLANCLILGAQAGVVAFGSGGGDFTLRWHEELDDRGNQLVVTAGTIMGVKKVRFNGKDFGCLSLIVDIT